MKPVMQTMTGTEGNCFPACIASLLEIRIDEIPSLGDLTWVSELNEWLRPRGLVHLDIRIAKDEIEEFFSDKDFHHVLTGPSPRLDGYDHSVIGRRGVMVHDPYIDGMGLDDEDNGYITVGILVSRCNGDHGG